MSAHRHFDWICVAVLVCTVLITTLFMNGARFGIETVKDGDAEGSTDSAYFTKNDRDGSWNSATATRIRLSGDSASVSGGGAYIYDGDVVIAQAGRYVVSGTLHDGSIRVSAESGSKVWLMLSGADISCSDDAPIRIEQADKVFITLAEGTENSLTGGEAYSESALADKVGGALFSRDDLTVNGSGTLRITAGYKHGIDANDELVITGGRIVIDAPGDGIHVNESFCCENAALTIRSGDEGIHVQGEEAELCITSGSFDIESGGAALKSAFNMLLTGGSYTVRTQADGFHSGGSIGILGGNFTIRAADDGIHADSAVSILDGRLLLEECYEGIEALMIDLSGGELEIYPGDDGLNANGGSFGGMFMRPGETAAAPASDAESETWIHISGGSLTVVNDTARDADGLDSNGDIIISGGSVRISLSSSGSNNAIDYGSESGGSCVITGGEVVACGSAVMAEGFSGSSTQCSILYNFGYNVAAGTEVSLRDAAGNTLLHYAPPCAFSSVSLSAPGMKQGETCTLVIGDREEQITLTNITTGAGESAGMDGMGWGSMRQRGDGGQNGGGPNGRPGFGGRPEGMATPSDQGFNGPLPPDGSFPPAGFDGERPAFSGMPGQGWPGAGQRPELQQTPEETELPAEPVPAEAQPVSTYTWMMVSASAFVLVLGILFAVKYRP